MTTDRIVVYSVMAVNTEVAVKWKYTYIYLAIYVYYIFSPTVSMAQDLLKVSDVVWECGQKSRDEKRKRSYPDEIARAVDIILKDINYKLNTNKMNFDENIFKSI